MICWLLPSHSEHLPGVDKKKIHFTIIYFCVIVLVMVSRYIRVDKIVIFPSLLYIQMVEEEKEKDKYSFSLAYSYSIYNEESRIK